MVLRYKGNPGVSGTVAITMQDSSVVASGAFAPAGVTGYATITAANATTIASGSAGAAATGSDIATLTVTDLSLTSRINVPFTFGHPFKQGEVASGQSVRCKIGATQIQTDTAIKSTYPDGSVRHAIITALVPTLNSAASQTVTLYNSTPASGLAISKADVLATAFDASATCTIGGVPYMLTARELLAGTTTAIQNVTHLSGTLCSEFIVGGRMSAVPVTHAHLAAYFHVRAYGSAGNVTRVRVSIVVENGWCDAASPSDFTYDVTMAVAGSTVFTQAGVVHTNKGRFVKRFWWGTDPQVYVKHDHFYLQDTKAVPKYMDLTPSAGKLNTMASGIPFALMSAGDGNPAMAATGSGTFIGPVPDWTATYLVCADKRAFDRMCANGDNGGAWPVHYRDELTGHAAAFTGSRANFQVNYYSPPGGSVTTLYADDAHQPSLAAVPYMVTGDYYYLEELQFWCSWNGITASTGTRTQVPCNSWQKRAIAWGFRTIAQAAAMTPDAHPLKSQYVGSLTSYLDQFYNNYVGAPIAANVNSLGATWDLDDAGNLTAGQFHPWMDHYFTWAIGYAVNQGFTGTASKGSLFRDWKCKYIAGLMGGDDYPWQLASPSYLRMGAGTAWAADFAAVATLNLSAPMRAIDVGTQQFVDYINSNYGEGLTDYPGSETTPMVPNEMIKYGHLTDGRPNETLLAIVAAVDAGAPGAELAYLRFSSRAGGPSVAEYADSPRFALVPYSKSRTVTTPMQMAALPAYVSAMAANSWKVLSTGNGFSGNLTISNVYSPNLGSGPHGYQTGVVNDWVGASYDWINHNFVIGPGGGHAYGGWYGNDVYSFGPMTSSNPQWTLRRQMSVPNLTSTGMFADGRPSAAHTYDLVQFDPITQQHLNIGLGSCWNTNGPASTIVPGFVLNPLSSSYNDWDMTHTSVPGLSGNEDALQGATSESDQINGRVFSRASRTFGLKKYNPSKKAWTEYSGDGLYLQIDAGSALNPVKRYMLTIGGYARSNDMQFWNIDTGARTTITNVTGPVDSTFWNTNFRIREKIGFCFHQPSGKFVAVRGSDIWVLTPPTGLSTASPNALTWTWVKKTPSGDTKPSENGNGTYSRFQYVPELNCFMTVDSTVNFVSLYKPDF